MKNKTSQEPKEIPSRTLVEAWDHDRKLSVLGYYAGKSGRLYLVDRLQNHQSPGINKFKFVAPFK